MINCFYYVTFQIDTVVVLVAFLLMTIYFNFQGTTSSTEITLRWWIMGSLTHLHLQPNRLHPTKPTTIKIKTNKTTIAMPTFQEQPVSFFPVVCFKISLVLPPFGLSAILTKLDQSVLSMEFAYIGQSYFSTECERTIQEATWATSRMMHKKCLHTRSIIANARVALAKRNTVFL